MQGHLSGWKQKSSAFASTLGAPGLFMISFLDSSVLTFPVINDLLVDIAFDPKTPAHDSVRHGGDDRFCAGLRIALFPGAEKQARPRFTKKPESAAQKFVTSSKKMDSLGMLVAALLPPPTPFKIFVLAAGVFRVPLWSFTPAIAIARVVRYFAVGYLAVHYGSEASAVSRDAQVDGVAALIVLVGISYGASKFIMYEKKSPREKALTPAASRAHTSSLFKIFPLVSISTRARISFSSLRLRRNASLVSRRCDHRMSFRCPLSETAPPQEIVCCAPSVAPGREPAMARA